MYIIKISINYHVELILTKNYLHEKTVYTYFVACSLCSLFFLKSVPYVNKVLKQSIINGRIEIVCILLARIYLQRRYRVVFVLFLNLQKKNLIKKNI